MPGTEGYPSPPSSQTMAGMEVVAEGQADENGEATLSDLVQNMGPNDQYFISAVTDPKSDKNYFYVTSSFQFSYSQGFGQTLNYTVSPNNFFTNPATYNSEYLIPTVSTTITMFPMLPRIAGTIYRADNPNAAVSGAQVQSLTYALFFWNTENSQPTQSNGSFEFDNLQPTYDDNANINGPIRGITITKYGFKDTSFAVNNGAFLRLGQQVYYNKILLDPAANVSGKVVDEQGNPVEAKVTIGNGSTVVANQPQFKGIVLGGPKNGSILFNYNTGFQSPAIFGSQQIIIDPTPYDASFFPDTENVNVTQDGQNLGTYVVKKKMHRIMVAVSTLGKEVIGEPEIRNGRTVIQSVQIPIISAHVTIQNIGSFLTNSSGTADTMFVNSSNNFTITVTAPDNQDYEGQTISANVPESKDWTSINVILTKASHVSGHVFAGSTPIPNAHVFLDEQQSPEATPVETYTANDGSYVLHDLPIGSSVTIDAAKSQSNYIGDSKAITVSSSGTDTLNFHLKVYNGMDITHLMGFPIEVTSLTTSGSSVSITGDIVHLPSNKSFSPLDSNESVAFHSIAIVAGAQRDSNNIPYAVPKTLPMVADANSIQLKIYGTLMGAQENGSGINIQDAGNGVGEFSGLTYIGASSFTSDPAFSNIKFPGDQIYLGLPNSMLGKLQIPAIVTSGQTPAQIQNGLLLSDNKGNSIQYTLYGFNAVADSSKSLADGDTVRLQTTIHSDLANVSQPDIDLNIGGVTLHSKKFDPIQGMDTIEIPLEKWEIEGDQWSISQSGGLMINGGQLKTGTVNLPFNGIQVTPTELKYGNFQAGSMSLAGILPLTITGQLYFGFDAGKGHWSMSVAPKGGDNSAAYLANLPGAAASDIISINNFYLLSNGDQGLTIDNTAPSITFYKVTTFSPTMLNVYSTYVHVPGSIDIHLPGLQAQSAAIDFSKTGGMLTSKLETFPFNFNAGNVQLAFPSDQNHPETLDDRGFYAEGTVSEPEKFQFSVWLYRTPDSTSIWTIPGQSLNIAGAASLTNIDGSMNVSSNVWKNFWFAGDLTGTNGASGRLAFTVYGDIVANNQQIGVKNISTPFGDLAVTYDFQHHALEGNLQVNEDLMGQLNVQGAADFLVDQQGWYFAMGGNIQLWDPHLSTNMAVVFGDYPMNSSIMAIVQQYSWWYQHKGNLPPGLPNTINGFYFEGGVDYPALNTIIPATAFNFGVVSAYLFVNGGFDQRIGMNFAQNGVRTYDIGSDYYADVSAGVGASVGIACVGVSAEVIEDISLDGQYKSNGQWYLDGSGSYTLTGSAYVGGGACNSDCSSIIDDSCVKTSGSASATVGVEGHIGTDTQYIRFFLK
ncbi:MAG: carboxypeptidase-like regulatory domain-containing protein [Candidatus Kryptoniota bacterium]